MTIQSTHSPMAAPNIDNLITVGTFAAELAHRAELASRTPVQYLLIWPPLQSVMVEAILVGKEK
jgi:hypothetical protein